VYAGKASATDHEDVARLGRERPPSARSGSTVRAPLAPPRVRRAWGEVVRRVSLTVERLSHL
jgi:hypothetical protein